MKVLLIEPPFHRFMAFYRHYYPLGLAYIASALLSRNHVVRIYDAEHDPSAKSRTYLETSQEYNKYLDAIENWEHPVWSEIRREISRFQPDLVGISVLTVKVPSALMIASICRDVCGNVPIVVGGEHPTARPQDLLKDDNVDFATRGEGELTICQLADSLEKADPVDSVAGLSFKSDGKIHHNNDRGLIENLDDLSVPARNLLANKETYRPVDFGLIMGSRGCQYKCTFCPNQNIWGTKVRFRSPSSVIAEIKSVHEEYSTDYFSFRDYSFSVNPKWTIELCKMIIQERVDVQWECTTRPNLISDETVSWMKKAGCTTIRVGVESGSRRILNEIGKDVSLRAVKEMARVLHRHKLYWAAYFMFGLPTETQEDIEKTFELIDEIDPPFVTMARYTPVPGTEIYQTLVNEGTIRENEVDWGQWGNQWLQIGFRKDISQEEFREATERIAKRIEEHNRRYRVRKPHPLLKLE